jgi:hypothetical protein
MFDNNNNALGSVIASSSLQEIENKSNLSLTKIRQGKQKR